MRRLIRGKGFVYVIYSGNTTLSKIGLSIYPSLRIKDIARLDGDPSLHLIRSIKVGNMLEVEAFLHEYFSDKHVHHEWFQLDYEDIKTIDWLTPSIMKTYPVIGE